MQAAAGAQVVTGRVASVGFTAPCSAGAVIRTGQWFPIRVQLGVQGSGTATRDLKFEGIDLDGDRVNFIRPQITVSTEGGSSTREVWCYGLINELSEYPRTLALVDPTGQTQERLPLPPVDRLSNDELLIVDLSDQPLVSLNRLVTRNWSPGERNDAERNYYRSIAVSRMTAAELPDRWIGLESADVIVWDQPSAADLKRIVQLDALIEWVRAGGQLIVGLGASWDAIRASPLAPLLPLDPTSGTTVELADLPVFRERLGSDRRPSRPVIAALGTLTPDAVRTLGEFGGPRGSIDLVTMRLVGSGRVVATAVSLRDLSAAAGQEEALFGELLDLNRYTDGFKLRQGEFIQRAAGDRYIYDDLVSPISFGTATAARGALALLFIAGYIVTATLASWLYLVRRKLTGLSWTVFTVTAVLASALSLGTVGLTRGCASGVQSLAIVDLVSGESEAHGFSVFGFRSPTRSRDDLSLPGKGNFLRPLSRSPRGRSFYVTPDRYAARPLDAVLSDVLVRATLKQVEGHWRGELDGTIRGQILVDRRTGEITPDSFLVNDTDVPLADGFLLFSDPRQEDNGVPRPAGRTQLYDEPNLPPVPPSMNVLAVQIGEVPARGRVTRLGSALYTRVARDRANWAAGGNPQRALMPDLLTLYDVQNIWRGNVLLVAQPPRGAAAVLLGSTRNYHLHGRGARYESTIDSPLSTEGVFNLEISHWLVSGRAANGRQAGFGILIAWSAATGPARLHLNGQPQAAYAGMTVYRVRVPIEYVGSPPGRGP